MEILKACENDLPEILILQRLAFRENAIRYDDPDIPPIHQTLDELAEESRGQLFLKAVCEGKIIGTARGRLEGDVCRISKVIVHPDHQNRGIGHELIAAIENEFDVSAFVLRTGHLDEKNISLYKKLGYVVEGDLEKITEHLWFVHMRKQIEKNVP
ncbi:MAG: GNAT family N-acetyltransferase [Candidatus Methanoplasma sp.]|jgi:ribosomal protein S18 acetylase RimI-like enzyme|nr:GNAT family N-acetyltransferase [Candidatus Methanoplasma sp.]